MPTPSCYARQRLHAGAGSQSEADDLDSDLMDLDEAANTAAENGGGDDADGEEENDHDEFGGGLHFGNKPLAGMLKMSLLENLKWVAGFPLPASEIAHRIMVALDTEHEGSLPVSALDFILKHIEGELPLSKETFDLAEVCSEPVCTFIDTP